MKDFIHIADFTGDQLARLLQRAIADKAALTAGTLEASLGRKTLSMIFEKPSLRTRVSFETAMTQLGGHALYLAPADIGLGVREPVQDVARVLGRMCDGVLARTFSHDTVLQLAENCPAPVINALSDFTHPCQAMADLMTIIERLGELTGKTIAFVGDGNNVARSLATACSKLAMKFILSAPAGYELQDELAAKLRSEGGDDCFTMITDPLEAVSAADVVYADTWVSMGDEDQKAKRVKDFDGYQINADLMKAAPAEAIVMHCLPAYRGYEITDDVFEAHSETIFTQAENRLHFQRSLLAVLIGEGEIR